MDQKIKSKTTRIAGILIIFTIVLISVSSSTASTLADSQWPKNGHDNQNTGQSQYLGPQNNTTQWTKNLSEDVAYNTNPIIGPDGTIYLGTNNYTSVKGKFYAFNPDGTVKWNYTVTDGECSEISSTPAISSEGTIFLVTNFGNGVTDIRGNIIALSNSGTYLWNYTIYEGIMSEIYSSPAIGSDGTVYFIASICNEFIDEVKLFALNKDGTLKWDYDLGETYKESIGSPVIGNDGTIYAGINSWDSFNAYGILYALTDAGDHAIEKWNFPVVGESDTLTWIMGSPAIGSDGTIYFGAGFLEDSETGYEWGSLYALTDSGDHATVKWDCELFGESCGITTSPAIAKDGTIYLGYYYEEATSNPDEFDEYYGLMAITDNITHTELKWKYDTDYYVDYTPVIGADGTVYFGDYDSSSTFYALNSNGTVKWSLEASPVTAAAISKVGTLYFGSYDRPGGSCGLVLYAIQGSPSSLYVKTSVDNTNPSVGDTVTITYYVGNNGPNTAYGTVLKFVIPAGMKFVKAWTSYPIGSINYDAATNTVIWDLGNLPIIDPAAWVQLIAQAAGEIRISPSITTLTNDPTISGNIQSITLNVHAATRTVSTKTVGMQTTGIPVVMLLTAVLMILGGSLVPRIKK